MSETASMSGLHRRKLALRKPLLSGKRSENGGTLVEFALVALMFFTFFFGIMDVCRALYSYHFVSYAARAATRFAAVRGSSCSGLAGGCPASQGDIQTYVRGITPPGIVQGSITVTAVCGAMGAVNATCSSPNNSPGDMVNVTVQYNYAWVFGFVRKSSTTMRAHSQLVISQ